MRFLLILFIGSFGNCFSQTDTASIILDSGNTSQSFLPNTISTHPLGVLISRISHNFQMKPSEKSSIALNISSGNVWLPYVKGYFPLNVSDINSMENIVWSAREFSFDFINSPSKTIEFHADAVIRLYQFNLIIPISHNFELKLNTRCVSADRGNIPFSLLTSDQFIEWFHSTLAGGEDPFARKVYGFNKTKISYTDENGKTFTLDNGDFIFSGVDVILYYYPTFKSLIKRNIYINFGLQTGINTNRINPSLDIGLNSSVNKQITIGSKRKLQLGVATGILRQKVQMLGEGVQISSNKFLFSAEVLLNYQKQTAKGSFISFGTSYFVQSPYNNKDDYKSIVLSGDRISSHWHYSLSHLYRYLSYNTLFITYSKGAFSISAYVKEDLLVDNAPDVQTGLGLRVNF
jgi:hypothetical protein